MTRLIPKHVGSAQGEIHLAAGCNLIGQAEESQIPLLHESVSRRHCEIWLTNEGVFVRDLNSRNGTAVDGSRVSEAQLWDGQTLRIGDLEFLLVGAPARISVPELQRGEVKQQIFFEDGTPVCFRHDAVAAAFRCGKCERHFCRNCVRELRVAQGAPHRFCPECGGQCERIAASTGAKKKSSWLDKIVNAFTKPPSRRG